MSKSGEKDKGKEQIDESPADELEAEAPESDDKEVEVEVVESDPLEQAQQELAAAKEEYLRLAAEFDNYKKRQARNLEGMIRGANERLLLNLLEVLDNFERALSVGGEKPEFEKYHQGMKLIYDQLRDALQREGLSRFDSLGEQFDPNLHEAMLTMQSDEYEPDQIAHEIAPGYKLHDKVIRHARVGVVGPKEDNNED